MEKRKQQQRGERVKQQVGEMAPTAIESENLHIQHVGQPGYGEPVRGLARGERPLDAIGCNALADLRIIRDVIRIIEIDEIEMGDRRVDGKLTRKEPGKSREIFRRGDAETRRQA